VSPHATTAQRISLKKLFKETSRVIICNATVVNKAPKSHNNVGNLTEWSMDTRNEWASEEASLSVKTA
jgi:hypothetical protein